MGDCPDIPNRGQWALTEPPKWDPDRALKGQRRAIARRDGMFEGPKVLGSKASGQVVIDRIGLPVAVDRGLGALVSRRSGFLTCWAAGICTRDLLTPGIRPQTLCYLRSDQVVTKRNGRR